MATALTPDDREFDRLLAQRLIEDGTVTSWAELGRRFGITGQAANQRFGRGTDKRPGYGLQMPDRPRRYTRPVTMALSPESYRMLETLRARAGANGHLPSVASVARLVMEKHLPEDVAAGQ